MAAKKGSARKVGRVSVKRATAAVAALKAAAAKQSGGRKTAAKKAGITSASTATGRHLVSFRVFPAAVKEDSRTRRYPSR